MPALRGSPVDYRQHLEVETPEHVVLDLEIAGIGSRTLAAVLDMLILGGSVLAVVIVLAIFGGYGLTVGRLGGAILLLGGFVVWTGYFIVFEGVRGGQTPGKRIAGIRVVMDTGTCGHLQRRGRPQSPPNSRLSSPALPARRAAGRLSSPREASR